MQLRHRKVSGLSAVSDHTCDFLGLPLLFSYHRSKMPGGVDAISEGGNASPAFPSPSERAHVGRATEGPTYVGEVGELCRPCFEGSRCPATLALQHAMADGTRAWNPSNPTEGPFLVRERLSEACNYESMIMDLTCSTLGLTTNSYKRSARIQGQLADEPRGLLQCRCPDAVQVWGHALSTCGATLGWQTTPTLPQGC